MTTDRATPRYPIYVPSRGRVDQCLTARWLVEDGVEFSLVVQPDEAAAYADRFPTVPLLVVPRTVTNLLTTRLWIREHALALDADRHWQLDDNMRFPRRLHAGLRIRCHSGVVLSIVEDFTDRYTNIGISGLNYQMFVPPNARTPLTFNCHVYSASLINNRMPYRWRIVYNDDTDLCLQVLAGGLCTVLFNAFMINKQQTMTIGGGNTADLYQGDGRLRMARALERLWPGVVTVDRRFQRPQHVIKDSWKRFDTAPIRRPDLDWDQIPPVDDYDLRLRQVDPIRHPEIARFLEKHTA